jgi:hypothetical protein
VLAHLIIVPSASHSLGETRRAGVSAGQRNVALVVEDYGSLSGVVTLPGGEPVAAFSVFLLSDPPGDPTQAAGERGAWSAPWLAPGAYRIAVLSAEAAASPARTSLYDNTTVSISLEPALTEMGLQKRPAIEGMMQCVARPHGELLHELSP